MSNSTQTTMKLVATIFQKINLEIFSFTLSYSFVVLPSQVSVSGFANWRFLPSRTYGIDAENQNLINHKCVCGALNRHFCQTRVTSWPSVLLHCQALSSIGFRCFCPTVLVSAVGGEKIKHRRVGEKN